jgi:hypothetical protein
MPRVVRGEHHFLRDYQYYPENKLLEMRCRKNGRRGRHAFPRLPKVGENIFLVMCVYTQYSRGGIDRDKQLWRVVRSILQ